MEAIDYDTPDIVLTNVQDDVEIIHAVAHYNKIGIGDKTALMHLAHAVNSGGLDISGKTFVLTNDISLQGESWSPMNFSNVTFNGNGHKIFGLYMDGNDSFPCGLFRSVTNSTIKNLAIKASVTRTDKDSGILAGSVSSSTITNCYTTGSVEGRDVLGGFVGYNDRTEIGDSYSKGTVQGMVDVGGFAGVSENPSIKRCYASGDVSCEGNGGGFACNADGVSGCYVTNNITCTSSEGNAADFICKGKPGEDTGVYRPEYKYLQVGINADKDSQIASDTSFSYDLDISDLTSDSAYESVTKFINDLSAKAVEYGAAQNRLESALESVTVCKENLVLSRSTIKDADLAKESSEYLKRQILQQAAATLLATANQSPSIALQLI